MSTPEGVSGIDSIFLYTVPDGYTIDPKHAGRTIPVSARIKVPEVMGSW